MKRKLSVVLFVLNIVVFSQALWAQSYASINGTITDPTNAVVAGAQIELENINTHATRETTTDNAENMGLLLRSHIRSP